MMLSVENVSAGYGRTVVLRDVSLAVPEGAIVTLLGANGAGKTTLLRTISGAIPARTGRILFDGDALAGIPPERAVRLGIAHVPEGRGIFPSLSVRENLLMGQYARKIGRRGSAEAMEQAADLFPVLGQRLGQAAGTLSGGEQQMLAIARALVTRPRLLMIDELSLGLAPLVIDQLLGALDRIRAEGVTILLVDQFARLVLRMSDSACVLERGSVAFAGSSRDLIDNPSALHGAYLGGSSALQEV